MNGGLGSFIPHLGPEKVSTRLRSRGQEPVNGGTPRLYNVFDGFHLNPKFGSDRGLGRVKEETPETTPLSLQQLDLFESFPTS